MTERELFIKGLRDFADFLQEHPSVKVPSYVSIDAFVHTREDIIEQAKLGHWQKVYNDTWFSLHKEFAPTLVYNINTERDVVCKRVVKGTKTLPATPERTVEDVEWVCTEPLLAGRDR